MTSSLAQQLQGVRQYFSSHVTKPEQWRRKQINGLISLVTDNEAALLAALQHDLGKPALDAVPSELLLCTSACRHALLHLSSWMQPQHVATPLALAPASSYTLCEPLGVVLIIGPFNYPVQLTLLPLLAALSAGNCAVLKPSELTEATSTLLCSLIPRYIDPHAVVCIPGGVDVTTSLLHLRWDHIFFTGSERVGAVVLKAAAPHLTPVTLELGGCSPCIVDGSGDVRLAAKRIVWGKALNAGQSCTSPNHVFVHSSVREHFLRECKHWMQVFFTASPQASPDFGRIVNAQHVRRLAGLIAAHRSDVVAGGEVDEEQRYVALTLLDLKAAKGAAMEEEVFGPLLPVIPYTDLSSVLAHINARPKPLALYLFTTDAAVKGRVIRETSSGGLVVNDVMVQSASLELPFGGVGASGIGRYHGRWGFEQLSHVRAVMERSEWGDAAIRYPPSTSTNLALYRSAMGVYRITQDSVVNAIKLAVPVVSACAAYKLGWLDSIRARL